MTLVVKLGGAIGNALAPVVADLVGRSDFVLVHGGSDEVDRLGEALGRPAEYYTSPSGVVSRRSTAAHLEVVVLALAGQVQTGIVAELGRHGIRSVGLSGVDDRLLLAHRKEGVRAVVDGRTVRLADDLSGTVERVNDRLLRLLLTAGIAPVVGPPAVTESGEVVNVDADRVAARVAVALGAETLLLLTNVAGLFRDPNDPSTLIARVPRAEVDAILPVAQGRMRKKVIAARDALEGGVARVVIAPSGVSEPIRGALAGHGTVFE
jgi:[amino group carrier protein]-L-2-aminoadipate 6-kinase